VSVIVRVVWLVCVRVSVYICVYIYVCVFVAHGVEGISVLVVFWEFLCGLDVCVGFVWVFLGGWFLVNVCCGGSVLCLFHVLVWFLFVDGSVGVFVLWCAVLRVV